MQVRTVTLNEMKDLKQFDIHRRYGSTSFAHPELDEGYERLCCHAEFVKDE
jgi:hypothetical protein